MDGGVEQLSAQEQAQVKSILIGLVDSLQTRKGVGVSGLLPDEEIILNALQHPERGDVGVVVLRDEKQKLQVFIVNRRDPDAPFAVMSGKMLRDFPERRFLNSRPGHVLKDDEYTLFLITAHDRDALHSATLTRVKTYSSSFRLQGEAAPAPAAADDLATKPVGVLSLAEKLTLYRRTWQGDARHDAVQNELFGFRFAYPRYKMPPREELLLLTPEKYKERLSQLIREMYPHGVRVSLRRDFPQEHRAKIGEVHRYLLELSGLAHGRNRPDAPPELNRHYEEISAFLREVVEKDPELSHFV